jgi:hypothetical protein
MNLISLHYKPFAYYVIEVLGYDLIFYAYIKFQFNRFYQKKKNLGYLMMFPKIMELITILMVFLLFNEFLTILLISNLVITTDLLFYLKKWKKNLALLELITL